MSSSLFSLRCRSPLVHAPCIKIQTSEELQKQQEQLQINQKKSIAIDNAIQATKKFEQPTTKVVDASSTKKRKLLTDKQIKLQRKVTLLKIKTKAIGDSNILPDDRLYLKIIGDVENHENSAPNLQTVAKTKKKPEQLIFVNKNYTVGKVLDIACQYLKIQNQNHQISNRDNWIGLSLDNVNRLEYGVLIIDLVENGDTLYII